MKSIKTLFSLIFGLFLVISCVPEADNNGDLLHGLGNIGGGTGGGGNTGGGTTGKRIASYVEKDLSTNKTNTFTFTYDGNLLKAISDSNNTTDVEVMYENGKIISVSSINKNTTSVYTLQYNNSSLKSIAGVINDSGNITLANTELTYSGSKISKAITKYSDNGTLTDIIENTYKFTGNNLSDFNFLYKDDSGNQILNFGLQFLSFDNKKNPFTAFPKELIYTLQKEWLQDYYIMGLCENNTTALKAYGDASGGGKVNYTYDSDGYPLTLTSPDIEITFTYK